MFDAVNVSLGGHSHRNSGNSKGYTLKATEYNSARGPMSDEKKAATAFVKAISNWDFNTQAFAFFIYSRGPQVTKAALKVFEALLVILAGEFDADRLETNEEINMGVEAKRLLDYSRSYGRRSK